MEQVRDAAAAAVIAPPRRARRGRRRARRADAEPPRPRPAPKPRKALPFRILRTWHRIDRLPGVRWVKKMIAFPIGERFAVISLTAALFTPAHHVHHAARVGRDRRRLHARRAHAEVDRPMSAPATAAPVPPKTDAPLNVVVYRDDGPLAHALGRALAGRVPGGADLLAGLAPLIAAVAIEGGDASDGLLAAVIAWLILCGGASSGTLPREHRRWALPVLVRLGEYLTLVWIGADRRPGRVSGDVRAAGRARLPPLRPRVPPAPPRRGPAALAEPARARLGGAADRRLRAAGGGRAARGVLHLGRAAGGGRDRRRLSPPGGTFERARRPALYEDDEDEID